jgi:hypothetical protein
MLLEHTTGSAFRNTKLVTHPIYAISTTHGT